ncbi:MAG: hypothetical protein RSG77_14365, partial [Hafnia sp.]
EGDISKVPGMPKLDHSRPNSKWTFVALSGYEWHVRVCPKDIDNQALGRPAGLSFATTFTSPYEAHRFADSIDEYLDNIFVQQSVVHQNYADLNKDYRKILLRMYLASEKLDEEKYEEASRILEFSTGLEYVDYACGVYWPGGYNLYTDPNSAVGKMMNLESEGTPYRVTHLLEVSSRHKPDHYYPDQATYEQKTTE